MIASCWFSPPLPRWATAGTSVLLAALTLGLAGMLPASFAASAQDAPASGDVSEPAEDSVRVGRLLLSHNPTGECFSDRFLTLAARHGELSVDRNLHPVALADEPALYRFPLLVMAGRGEIRLTDDEKQHLRAYLRRGGLLLASAGCSDRRFAESFPELLNELLPKSELEALSADHAIYHSLFELDGPQPKRPTRDPAIFGLSLGDRLAVVYSPLGLNDTATAGPGCCCCGGNELRNAHLINANLLAHALTH